MSLYDYEVSKEIERQDYPFYALIMAAMRQADSYNLNALRIAFPATSKEFKARYHAPGGRLEGEQKMCKCGHADTEHVEGHGCTARLEDMSECECGLSPSRVAVI